MTKSTFIAKDNSSMDESVTYWFDVEGDQFGVVECNGVQTIVDCDGVPVVGASLELTVTDEMRKM